MALRISTGLRNKINGINTNLLTNGDFGTDDSGWTKVAGTVRDSGAGANNTTGFVKCIADGTNAGSVSNTTAISVKPHNIYKVRFYVKKAQCNGKVVISTAVSGGGTIVAESIEYSDTSWAQKEFWFRNNDSTTLYITFKGTSASGTDRCDFDELELIHAPGALQEIFYKGYIKLYSGSQPATPNDAPTGNLLVTIYSNGTSEGLTFGDSANGTMAKKITETWSGTAVGSGTQTAGWFRLVTSNDSGASSQTDERIDGAVATSGAQLNMSSISITNGAVQTIASFQITIPSE